jgi:hypothetical protein
MPLRGCNAIYRYRFIRWLLMFFYFLEMWTTACGGKVKQQHVLGTSPHHLRLPRHDPVPLSVRVNVWH